MGNLTNYDAARRALTNARAVDEVKSIIDKAAAIAEYARRAKDTQMLADVTALRFDAELRLGEMLAEQKKTVGLATGGDAMKARYRPGTEVRPTLLAVGIDKKLSARSQKLAAMSREEYSAMVGAAQGQILAKADKVPTQATKKAKKAKKKNVHHISTAQGCTVKTLEELAVSGQTFGTIYADPPWQYANQGTRASTDNHYSGLTVDQLCALPVKSLAAPDAHLHLWTTNGFLFECPKIFEAWGFEFKSSFVWVKPQIGMGNYWRNAHEFLLTAVRGDATRFNDKNLKSWIECARGKHSAKPEQVRHFIERASGGPRLELFGRSSAPGWVVWGDQIEKTIFDTSVAEVA